MDVRSLLEALERGDAESLEAPLAYVAGRSVALGDDELNAARRRALLVLAAGGDPHREIGVEERAVRSLGRDLDAPERRLALRGALTELRAESEGLQRVSEALDRLIGDPALAWGWLACSLLAEELADAAR